jgi:hypothetical protein
LLAHGRWFSPGTLASSTTKTGHHDIAEILLKHQKSKSKSENIYSYTFFVIYKAGHEPTLYW